jgi:hypothetical protein
VTFAKLTVVDKTKKSSVWVNTSLIGLMWSVEDTKGVQSAISVKTDSTGWVTMNLVETVQQLRELLSKCGCCFTE